jgi:hypothetical protein
VDTKSPTELISLSRDDLLSIPTFSFCIGCADCSVCLHCSGCVDCVRCVACSGCSGCADCAGIAGAIECRQRKRGEAMAADGLLSHRNGKPLKRRTYAGRLRLQVSSDRRAPTCEGFVADNVLPGSLVRTDGWNGYDGLMGRGYRHDGLTLDGDGVLAESHLPMIHLVFSNLKTWILGTHYGTSQQHKQAPALGVGNMSKEGRSG